MGWGGGWSGVEWTEGIKSYSLAPFGYSSYTLACIYTSQAVHTNMHAGMFVYAAIHTYKYSLSHIFVVPGQVKHSGVRCYIVRCVNAGFLGIIVFR